MDTNILKDILTSPVGSFAFVFGIIAAIVWVVHYVTKYATKISESHKTLDKNINRVEDNLDKKITKIEDNIDEIRKDLAYVKGALEVRDLLIQKNSPISLTEMGEQIREEYKFDDIISVNWDKILSEIDLAKLQNPYDVQEYCISTSFLEPTKFFTEKDVNELKIVAFKSGLTFMSVARAMGVLIRDAYFKYKNIDINEVDKYNPKP
jgi:hypothetical protein